MTMKLINRIKRSVSLVLALCVGLYGLPAFSMATPAESRIALSDQAMADAVGGNLDARILTPFGVSGPADQEVQAVVTFGDPTIEDDAVQGIEATYRFGVYSHGGQLLQLLDSGTLVLGSSKRLKGTVTGGLADVGNGNLRILRVVVEVTDTRVKAQADSQIF